MSEGTTTPFRRELKASVPLALADVLGFYRRELGKRNWKEESKGAVVTGGQRGHRLHLARRSGGAQARPQGRRDQRQPRREKSGRRRQGRHHAEAGPGQGSVRQHQRRRRRRSRSTGKTIKVAAGAGTKGPDGPSLDLPPGKYKYSIKLPGKPAQNDEVEVGADETWGLMIGPGGVLAMQAY